MKNATAALHSEGSDTSSQMENATIASSQYGYPFAPAGGDINHLHRADELAFCPVGATALPTAGLALQLAVHQPDQGLAV